MDQSLLNSLQKEINRIHQYDETTNIRNSMLDTELEDVTRNCEELKQKMKELRKESSEKEALLEEAIHDKKMAKRSYDRKVAMISCLEAELERLDDLLTDQEKKEQHFKESIREDPVVDIIGRFQGIHLEKKAVLDERLTALSNHKKLLKELDAELVQLNEKTSNMEKDKASLITKEDRLKEALQINARNDQSLPELRSANASMSGKQQFLEEKTNETIEKLEQLKANVNSLKDKETASQTEMKEWEQRLSTTVQLYTDLELEYGDKMSENTLLLEELQMLGSKLEEFKRLKEEVEVKKKEIGEHSKTLKNCENSNVIQQNVERALLTVREEIPRLNLESEEKQRSLQRCKEKYDNAVKLNDEVQDCKQSLGLLNQKLNEIGTNNNECIAELENIAQQIENVQASFDATSNELQEKEQAISSREAQISEKQANLELMPAIQTKIEESQSKIIDLESDIKRLMDHENQVENEILSQGKHESDRLEKESADARANVEAFNQQREALHLQMMELEEEFKSTSAAIKNKRNESINSKVEAGIKEIDTKVKIQEELYRSQFQKNNPRIQVVNNGDGVPGIMKKKANEPAKLQQIPKSPIQNQFASAMHDKVLTEVENHKDATEDMNNNMNSKGDAESSESDDPFGVDDSSDESQSKPASSANKQVPNQSKPMVVSHKLPPTTPSPGLLARQQVPKQSAPMVVSHNTSATTPARRMKRMLIDTTKKSSHIVTKDAAPLLTREEGKSSLKNEEARRTSSSVHGNAQESVLQKQEAPPEATKTPGSRRQKRLLITK